MMTSEFVQAPWNETVAEVRNSPIFRMLMTFSPPIVALYLLFAFLSAKTKPASSFPNYFGVTWDNEAARKLLAEASPATYVRAGLPPFLLLHGNKDARIPYEQSVSFQEKLKAAGVPVELITVEGGGHGMGGWEKLNSDYMVQLVTWLNRTLKS